MTPFAGRLKTAAWIVFIVLGTFPAGAEERFPSPEFESGYAIPSPVFPEARPDVWQWIDASVLLAALALASACAVKWRTRHGLFLVAVFSVLYFGFFRLGCVCAVGSVQNVAASLGDPGYRIGMGALLFFTLPLCFALFYGRTFCAGVCPLGAIQELFIWRPQRVPPWIAHVLGMIPWIYLGAAVLFAAVGARFLICLYDPFVGFFRLGGPLGIMAAGGALLVLGLFVARPYCRFLCPYGVLLGCFSLVSRRHLSITPDRCIQCRLCEDSCPVGAIEKPESPGEPGRSGRSPLRLGFWMLMVPVSIAVFGFGVRQLAPVMARSHQTVRLARQVRLEREGMAKHETLDSEAFRQRGESFETLYREAGRVKRRFETGGWILGAFLGLVFASKGIVLTLKPRRTDYEPDRFHCVSCGRCMEYCPVKKGDLEKR